MNYCPNCGTANRDGSRFCNDCGHKLPSKTGIVCPMCSHINPAANVYCDNCQARLVPAAPDSSPLEDTAPAASGSTAPIKGLSLPTKPTDEPEPPEIESGLDQGSEPEPEPDESPDWLVRLRAAAPTPSEREPDTSPPAEEAPSSADEIPDWMRPAEGEAPDWFQRIAESADEQPSAPLPEPSPGEELPNWLQQISDRSELSEQPALEASPLDWPESQEATSSIEAESLAPADETELPDWLKDLGVESKPTAADIAPATTEPAPVEESAEDVPSWLAGIRDEPQAEKPVSETPGQLSDLQAPLEAEAADVVPDWLTDLRGRTEAELPVDETPDRLAETLGEPETEAPVDATPDWLADMSAQPEAQTPLDEVPSWLAAVGEQPQAREEPVAETPEWLDRLSEAPSAEPAVEAPSVEAETPDWLLDIRADSEAAAPSMEVVPAGDEVPDWLKDIRAESPEAEEAALLPAEGASAFVGDEAEPSGVDETPEWLTDVSKPSKPTGPLIAPAEVPDWIRDLGPTPASALSEETPFGEPLQAAPGDIPEWLRDVQPGQAPPTFADESGRLLAPELDQAAEVELEAAAIPSWLQALRPSDTTGAAAMPEEGVAETEGILAGIQNALPSSEFMGKPQGPLAVRNAQIPAADLARAGLFQELLARGSLAPTVIKPGQAYKTRVRARVGRWLIAVAILVAAFVPNVSDFMAGVFQLDNADALFQPAADQIDSLAAGQNVLVAFDYDPFQAGEMDPLAEAFLTHIHRREAQAIAVSLNPAGPALATRVVERLEQAGVSDAAVVQPRYFPGQAVGAQSVLVSHPADVIVVLAGSPEAMRWWIEQLGASGVQTPVVAGASAGVLPQLQPYVQSGQVKAVVQGLMGGLAYRRSLDSDRDSGTEGFDRVVRSEALYLSQVVFALVLVVGLIVSLLAGVRQAR